MNDALQQPFSILVVDDNQQNLAFARMTLEEEGYEVALASSGEQGIAQFRQHPFDCVLLDVRMRASMVSPCVRPFGLWNGATMCRWCS